MLRSVLSTTFFILFFVVAQSQTQVRVSFNIKERPVKHSHDTVYVTGGFAGWRPGDRNFSSKMAVWGPVIEVQLEPGNHEYKFTRGSWDKGEVSKTGADVQNRLVKIVNDTSIDISIGGWRDDFPVSHAPRRSTASSNVRTVDTAFTVKELGRMKGIFIYLPPGYETSNKKYPVIYMHDAQNLFDERRSSFGQEWAVDETLDSMIKAGAKPAIIVAIDNDAQKRLNEYNPYDHSRFGKAEGNEYLNFIIGTLKPFIDKNFRTLANKKNTFIAGSSMGGLISFYAILKYPDVFGGAGVFSPAFWVGKGIETDVEKLASKVKGRVWFYAGGKEGEEMVPDMKKIHASFDKLSKSKTVEIVDDAALHNEAAWRKWFGEFYRWIMK